MGMLFSAKCPLCWERIEDCFCHEDESESAELLRLRKENKKLKQQVEESQEEDW